MNQTSQDKLSGTGCTVLLVDDDEDFLFQASTRLRHDGYTVLEAQGQAAAEELLPTAQFDVAVLDLMMEHMDSGFVLCHRIKRKHPKVPVLLVTGVVGETGLEFDASNAEERRWIRADVLLAKPVRYEQLKGEIERLRALS